MQRGRVAAWGFNQWGQGRVPVAPRDVTAIATGDAHSLALQRDGTVVGWGYEHTGGQPPDGLRDVVAIAANGWHSLALRKDGTVVFWGHNSWGSVTSPLASATSPPSLPERITRLR